MMPANKEEDVTLQIHAILLELLEQAKKMDKVRKYVNASKVYDSITALRIFCLNFYGRSYRKHRPSFDEIENEDSSRKNKSISRNKRRVSLFQSICLYVVANSIHFYRK